MAKKIDKKFNFKLAHLIRLSLFFLAIILLINFFSHNSLKLDKQFNLNFLPSVLKIIPKNTQDKLTNIPYTPAVLGIKDELNKLKENLNGFPQKQINDLKKEVINRIYQSIIKDIDD